VAAPGKKIWWAKPKVPAYNRVWELCHSSAKGQSPLKLMGYIIYRGPFVIFWCFKVLFLILNVYFVIFVIK